MKANSLFRTVVAPMASALTNKLLFGVLILSATTISTHADDLEKVLSSAYPAQAPVSFVKHASVVQPSADNEYTEKYMVLDFKIENEQQLQASIHSICNTILTDHSLIEQLSNSGYDMISVSFDPYNQYDCL